MVPNCLILRFESVVQEWVYESVSKQLYIGGRVYFSFFGIFKAHQHGNLKIMTYSSDQYLVSPMLLLGILVRPFL